jgi:hypothetical protein
VSPQPEQLASWADAKRFWAQSQQYAAWGKPRKNYVNCTRRFRRCQFFQLYAHSPKRRSKCLRKRDELGAEAIPFGFRKIESAVMDTVDE